MLFKVLKDLSFKLNLYSQNGKIRKLLVYNSFLKKKVPLIVNGNEILVDSKTSNGNSTYLKGYICGPTVYDDSHLGHALTYLRFDLIRRVLKSFCSTDLISIMNITDIDDKIIEKASLKKKSCSEISKLYLDSFLKDLDSLNILPPNSYIKVTDQIDNIVEYIQNLEKNGYAYYNEKTGDIDFDTQKVDQSFTIFENDKIFPGRKSKSDFTLWKKHKNDEPYWEYKSLRNGQIIKGRPGWHVECSAINYYAYGQQIDLHFGGHDLLFPHHLNESRCCKAFNLSINQSKNNSPVHDWSQSWIHFGRLLIHYEKMSKSLGNFISIQKFIKKNSVNTLRILCIINPYKREISYDEGNLKIANDYNQKIINFYELLNSQKLSLTTCSNLSFKENYNLNKKINLFIDNNLDGIADDFNLNIGWLNLIDLITYIKSDIKNLSLIDLIKVEIFITNYFESLGLVFHGNYLNINKNFNDKDIIKKLLNYRKDVRKLILNEKIVSKNNSKNINEIIKSTDELRKSLNQNQLLIIDEKFNEKL